MFGARAAGVGEELAPEDLHEAVALFRVVEAREAHHLTLEERLQLALLLLLHHAARRHVADAEAHALVKPGQQILALEILFVAALDDRGVAHLLPLEALAAAELELREAGERAYDRQHIFSLEALDEARVRAPRDDCVEKAEGPRRCDGRRDCVLHHRGAAAVCKLVRVEEPPVKRESSSSERVGQVRALLRALAQSVELRLAYRFVRRKGLISQSLP